MLEWINIGVMCLALNIYHEARNQEVDGMYAVADVVMNRVEDYRYPSSVCGVVKQGPVRESWKTVQTVHIQSFQFRGLLPPCTGILIRSLPIQLGTEVYWSLPNLIQIVQRCS